MPKKKLINNENIEKKKKKSPKYSRTKGNSYERKIVNELNSLGFNVGTTRNNSREQDADKVDIYDIDGTLPCKIQLKCTQATPAYFKIRDQSSCDPEKFVIIWSKQEKRDINIISKGEVVMLPKRFFYDLIKKYGNS